MGIDGRRFSSVFVQPYVLSSVRKAEQKIVEAQLNHEYAGIEGKRLTQKRIGHAGDTDSSRLSVLNTWRLCAGIKEYVDLAMEFAYGKDCPALADKRVAAAQVRLRDLLIQN